MSAPTSPIVTADGTSSLRMPPYVAPASSPAASTGAPQATRVGPFVPAALRVAEAAIALSVPASIPPYRPLRPTPIVTPAVRTPLYIPPIPTPPDERAVEDEGSIEPQLVFMGDKPEPEDTAAEAASEFTTDAGADHALPWIDAFLASTPAAPVQAVAGEAVADAPRAEEGQPTANVSGEDAADMPTDEWPLEAAAAEFRVLRDQLPPDAAATESTPPTGLAPLPAWADDDLMDIMPIAHSGRTPLSSAAIESDGELWAERARKAHEEAQVFRAMAASSHPQTPVPAEQGHPDAIEATAEEAAHALEVLARRVRAGELALPSYDPRMGEPAALVAALAALLGVRLR